MLKSSLGYEFGWYMIKSCFYFLFFMQLKLQIIQKSITTNYKMAVTCKNTIQCIVEEFENFQFFCIYSPITHESHLY